MPNGPTYRPPFELTPLAMSLSIDIMTMVGRYDGMMSPQPQPKLRRANQIRTVVGSLAIEGNTLSLEQATAVPDHKRVIGSAREIKEVQNAIATCARAATFNPGKEKHLLDAHRGLMIGLVKDAGRYRSGAVGIFEGSRVTHVAPPAARVSTQVRQVLSFADADKDVHPLVRSAVAHYELEFIHPFSDGNGRMGSPPRLPVSLHFRSLRLRNQPRTGSFRAGAEADGNDGSEEDRWAKDRAGG